MPDKKCVIQAYCGQLMRKSLYDKGLLRANYVHHYQLVHMKRKRIDHAGSADYYVARATATAGSKGRRAHLQQVGVH
eukprot:1157821-Pelagomonas_calceolata.AAC.5